MSQKGKNLNFLSTEMTPNKMRNFKGLKFLMGFVIRENIQ